MNNNKNRKSSEKDYSNDSYDFKEQKFQNYFRNMLSSLKNMKNFEKKKKIKSLFTSDLNNYKKANAHHKKSNIKKNLESSINLSKNNFCGSFLFPDYVFVSGAEILKELKSKGPERTIRKHFSKDVPKANFLKNKNHFKSCSVTRNKGPNIKSKYFSLVNSNISRINNLTSFKKNKTKNCPNMLKYYDKYNKTFINYFNGNSLNTKIKKNDYFSFNTFNNKILKNSRCYINNKSKQSFYGSTINNSRTYLNSSTSCSSKTLKYSRRY
jgi:hypothetical protein